MHNEYSSQKPTGRQPESFLSMEQTVGGLLSQPIDTSNYALEVLYEAVQHSGTSGSGNEHGRRHKHEADRNDNDHVLQAWSSLRFVQTSLLTAREVLSFVTYFYTHLASLSPFPTLRFKDPSQHHKRLEEEPVLAITILMVTSQHKLSGPGAVARGDIYDRLWIYLRGMITKVVWSEEGFMCDAPNPENMQCSVLRTTGTCEVLLLLLEWHPKTVHFPSADNGTNSMMEFHRSAAWEREEIFYSFYRRKVWQDEVWRRLDVEI